MKRNVLKKWMEENVEIRPFNEKGELDGNSNYIHRAKVAEMIYKMRKEIQRLKGNQ